MQAAGAAVSQEQFTIAFAGGGTGGHLIPGLVLADELRRVYPGCRILLLSSGRAIEAEVLKSSSYEVIALHAPKLMRFYLAPVFACKFTAALLRSIRLLRKTRPRLVVGLGGYAQAPVVAAAWGLGIPTVLLEVNSLPGRANLMLAGKAQRIYVQFAAAVKRFKKPQNVLVTGCPVRAEILRARRDESLAKLGLSAGRPVVAVMGGSQGAGAVNQAVMDMLRSTDCAARWQFVHLAGAQDSPALRAEYATCGAQATVFEFCHDMAAVYAASDVVVSRAGASTIAELRAVGKPAVLIPFPHAKDDHQRINAEELAAEGTAELLHEKDLQPQRLYEAIGRRIGMPSNPAPGGHAPEQLIVADIERLLGLRRQVEHQPALQTARS